MKDPFDFKGYWWLPNEEENKLPGTLVYSQENGATLELLGAFDLQKFEPIKQIPIILGVNRQGTPFTLYNCIVTSWTVPMDGLGGGEYFAHFVFEGVHFEAKEKIKFNKLLGSYTDLDAWINIYGFEIDTDMSDNKNVSNIKYEKPKAQFFTIEDTLDVGIGFSSHGPNHSIVQTEVTISQVAYLIVKSNNEDIEFDELFKKLNTFTYLLQFAIQRIPYPISIIGLSKENSREGNNGNKYYPEIKIYYKPIEPIQSQQKKIPQEFLYTFGDLSGDQIINWFKSFDKYETIIHLYRSLYFSNRLFIDTKFLSIAQSLESLHSILFDNQYQSKKMFNEQKKRVLNSIPEDLIEWVEGALREANYKRFQQKIYELLFNKREITDRYVDDLELFSKRVTDTRNEFVHHNKKKLTFQNEELPSAISKLTITFELYLLMIIGFSDDKAKELLEPKLRSFLTGFTHLRTTK
jgi:hypothetical protein